MTNDTNGNMLTFIGGAFGTGGRNGSTGGDKRIPARRDASGRPIGAAVAPVVSTRGGPRKPTPHQLAWLVDEIEREPAFIRGYAAIAALCQYANVTIETDSTDPRAVALAANLQDVWYRNVANFMRAFAYGRQAFEFWYAVEGDLYVVAKLEPLPFRACKPNDATGELQVDTEAGTKVLAKDRCWWVRVDESAEWPDGKSRYIGAPEDVLSQLRKLKANSETFLAKFANGVFTGKAPSQYPEGNAARAGDAGQVDSNGLPANPMTDLAESWRAIRSGGILVTDSATAPDGGGPLFEVSSVAIQPQAAPLENKERALADQALDSIGVPPRSISQDSATGTYGMAETHRKILHATVEGLLAQFVTQFESLGAKAAAANGLAAKFRGDWQPLSEDRTDAVLALVTTILTGPAPSPLITSGVVDFEKLLDIAAIPKGADFTRALAEAKASAVPAAPQPFGMSRQLALTTGNEPPVDGWPDIATKFAEEVRAKRAELAAALQSDRERGHL